MIPFFLLELVPVSLLLVSCRVAVIFMSLIKTLLGHLVCVCVYWRMRHCSWHVVFADLSIEVHEAEEILTVFARANKSMGADGPSTSSVLKGTITLGPLRCNFLGRFICALVSLCHAFLLCKVK